MSDSGKHTPGPWRSGPHVRDTASMVYAGDYAGEGEPDLIVEIESEDHRADARLIAAAPELLEALKHERFCRACSEDGCANCNECTYEAAIRKAEGRDA